MSTTEITAPPIHAMPGSAPARPETRPIVSSAGRQVRISTWRSAPLACAASAS